MKKSLANQTFGSWTALDEAEPIRARSGKARRRWNVVCACGARGCLTIDALTTGHSTGCKKCGQLAGALKRERHGQYNSKEYSTWEGMMARCHNPRCKRYKDYGARGITVCAAWHDFAVFLKDMGHKRPGMSIERKNNNKGYEPGNCVWADSFAQACNTRRNVFITHPTTGRKLHTSGWAREFGVTPGTIDRLVEKRGIAEMFKRCELKARDPEAWGRIKYLVHPVTGEKRSQAEWAKALGIARNTLSTRVHRVGVAAALTTKRWHKAKKESDAC